MSECNNKQMRRLSISSNTLLRQWVLASVFTPDKHWSKLLLKVLIMFMLSNIFENPKDSTIHNTNHDANSTEVKRLTC